VESRKLTEKQSDKDDVTQTFRIGGLIILHTGGKVYIIEHILRGIEGNIAYVTFKGYGLEDDKKDAQFDFLMEAGELASIFASVIKQEQATDAEPLLLIDADASEWLLMTLNEMKGNFPFLSKLLIRLTNHWKRLERRTDKEVAYCAPR
jgi:hypothetical protein